MGFQWNFSGIPWIPMGIVPGGSGILTISIRIPWKKVGISMELETKMAEAPANCFPLKFHGILTFHSESSGFCRNSWRRVKTSYIYISYDQITQVSSTGWACLHNHALWLIPGVKNSFVTPLCNAMLWDDHEMIPSFYFHSRLPNQHRPCLIFAQSSVTFPPLLIRWTLPQKIITQADGPPLRHPAVPIFMALHIFWMLSKPDPLRVRNISHINRPNHGFPLSPFTISCSLQLTVN